MAIGYKLQDIDVNLSQLMLDPDNFRLDRKSTKAKTPDNLVEGLQATILEKLAKEQLTVLKNSIFENGFLEVDRIVVRKLDIDSKKPLYLVIEGNRRTAAFKLLIEEDEEGLIDLDEEIIDKSENINVVLVEGEEADIEKYINILMGVRHVSGPKPWTGLQSAKLIDEMFELQDFNASQIGSIMGISPQETNRRRRAFLAYKQLENDKKYGKYIDPDKHYALLSEFTGKRKLMEWLDWDDDSCIQNKKAKDVIYKHIVANDGQADVHNPTLARELVKAITIPRYEARLINGEMLSNLGPINSKAEDILKSFKSFHNLLKSITPANFEGELKELSNKIIKLLNKGASL
ncbi:hypothetical protein H5159_16580 [Pseudoalteromonas sp. SG43-1]|jgi:hypothetical protein|uniref:hypothetical protein n=1 Tax=Pseudoalteromonas sp. SG43-1 TaxID=2760971 RepID=UPI0016020526|nr:hypothetical protein [Pseudoalteromonas sp. SG43-1]MBB1452660.1 hypothetical protein [Pseudoalteromonas sp. SG43-1]